MKKIIFVLLLFPFVSLAQHEKEIDSLNTIIRSNVGSQKKVEPYGQLIEIYFESDPEKSREKIQELYRLNKNNSCAKCEIMADFEMATYHDIKGNRDSASAYYEKAANKSLKIKDYTFYQLSKTFKMYTYFNVGDLENAERELTHYFNLTKRLKLQTGYEEMYYLRGLIHRKKGFYNSAIEDLLYADKIIVDAKLNKMKLRVSVINEIALTYKDLNNYDKAIEYISKSIAESRKRNDLYEQMTAELLRGRIEVAFHNYQKAITHLQTARTYFKSVHDVNYTLIAELNLGISFYYVKQFRESVNVLKVAASGLQKTNSIDNYALALSYLALNNLAFNQFPEAKQHIDLANQAVANKRDFPFYSIILEAEIDYFKKTNNYTAAFARINLKDSLAKVIAQKSNIASLNEFEAKYQGEKKGQQIELLSVQNALAQKQKYISIGLLILLLLVGASVFYVYRNRIKTAQKLHELNELKSRFFANISHEFRTPLTLIKSPVQSLQSKINDKNQLEELALIDKNSNRMLELVNQLLELSKIDSGHLKLLFKDGNVGTFVAAIVEPFAFQANENGLRFQSSIQKTSQSHSFDKDVIEKITTNLLTNAFKYTPQKEAVDFTCSVTDNTLKIMVSNTGSNVKKENLPQFFERFYQKNDNDPGVGIGLALVKELVELYQGTIETQLDHGELSFIVTLPLAVANEKAVVVPIKSEAKDIENQIDTQAERPILLLVDDHADIRKVLKSIFEQEYTVLVAKNGEEALKLAQKEIPDCIISDVMMPKMDGFAFTSAIKNNELTSFIPVVLLTAKTTDQAHLDGLKSTADAFLTKPFNNKIVKATVDQLIAERQKLHARYSQELVLKPVDIVVNSLDQKFIAKLQVILEKELANADFSAEEFASAIGMSRMQLHRKLKSLLGVSATEFMRNERLKIAAELLKKGKGTVSEIAYATGFNNISYFSKCFKEMYTLTPSDYLNSAETL